MPPAGDGFASSKNALPGGRPHPIHGTCTVKYQRVEDLTEACHRRITGMSYTRDKSSATLIQGEAEGPHGSQRAPHLGAFSFLVSPPDSTRVVSLPAADLKKPAPQSYTTSATMTICCRNICALNLPRRLCHIFGAGGSLALSCTSILAPDTATEWSRTIKYVPRLASHFKTLPKTFCAATTSIHPT